MSDPTDIPPTDKLQWTPGPWEIRYSKRGYPYQIFASYDDPNRRGSVVDITRWGAISVPSLPVGQANARLIAAAPELYEALALLHDNIAEYAQINNLGGFDNHDMRMARAALAKARGEKS